MRILAIALLNVQCQATKRCTMSQKQGTWGASLEAIANQDQEPITSTQISSTLKG